jgi:drug/metabolite transporter (DMT)-like permease
MALLLAGGSALLYGIADFCGGFAASRNRLLSVLVVSQLFGLLIALAALAVLGHTAPHARDLAWGLLAGLTGSMGLFMLYGGIARGIVAVVSPTSAVVGAVFPILFALGLGERPGATAVLGCALCVPAILMLSWPGSTAASGRGSVRSALGYGALAGLGFGAFFTALSRCRADAGLWPLVAARAASLGAAGLALLVRREPLRLHRRGAAITLLSGAADMGANILFLLASQCGLLSLVAVITSLFPAPTVLLARICFGERIPVVRLLGFLLALAGVALISLR